MFLCCVCTSQDSSVLVLAVVFCDIRESREKKEREKSEFATGKKKQEPKKQCT